MIDHIAKPRMGAGQTPDPAWREGMAALASLPNVWCKLSGMVTEVGPGWTFADVSAHGREVLDRFGPGRLMWGSDWPVLTLASTYAVWLAQARNLAEDLSVCGTGAAVRWHGARLLRPGQPVTRILCIGEAMAEIRRDGPGFAVGFAGDTFNTAVYCRRCLKTGSVGYLTRIGTDLLSEGFLSLAAREAIDVSAIRREAGHNIGIYSVTTDAAGERSFAYWRATSAARQLFQHPEDFETLEQADLLYLSGITLAILAPDARTALLDRLARLRLAGKRVAFDSNYRPKLWPDVATARRVISQAWALTDVALPSVDDEMALFDEPDEEAVLQRLRALGLRQGALKRGALGPIALDRDVALPAFAPASRIVDTTAAGDSFNGGFLAALAEGADAERSMIAGHDLARIVVTLPGAIVATGTES